MSWKRREIFHLFTESTHIILAGSVLGAKDTKMNKTSSYPHRALMGKKKQRQILKIVCSKSYLMTCISYNQSL